jgi:hypothetical protein
VPKKPSSNGDDGLGDDLPGRRRRELAWHVPHSAEGETARPLPLLVLSPTLGLGGHEVGMRPTTLDALGLRPSGSRDQQPEQMDMRRFKRGLSSSARCRLTVGNVIALPSTGAPPVRSASSISSKFL